MLRPEQDRLLVRAFDFDTVGFDTRVVLERVVNDPAVEGVHRFQFNDVSPAADFFGSVLRFLDQRVAGGGTVPADIDHHLGSFLVLMEEEPVEDVLQVTERLALAPNEAAGIVALHFQQQSFLQVMFFDRGCEAEMLQQFHENVFGLCRHNSKAKLSLG